MAAKIFIYLKTSAQAAVKNIHSKETCGFEVQVLEGVEPQAGSSVPVQWAQQSHSQGVGVIS